MSDTKEDLMMPDDYVQHVECCSCGEMVPTDEILTIGHDDICAICAPFAGVYRCDYCGKAFEKADKCPHCGRERKKEEEEE